MELRLETQPDPNARRRRLQGDSPEAKPTVEQQAEDAFAGLVVAAQDRGEQAKEDGPAGPITSATTKAFP